LIASTFAISSPHGCVVGVRLSERGVEHAHEHAELHPAESARAAELRGARKTSFVAGRLALARALAAVGAPRIPVGSDDRGAPILPAGFVGSISHKAELGVAMAAHLSDDGARVGVDVETIHDLREGVARLVLVEEERARIDQLPEDQRSRAVLASFSIKESIYKAIDPFVRRYVAYREAIVELPESSAMESGFARAGVSLRLAQGESIAHIEAYVTAREGLLLSTARARQ
jgi:4'-phosphopantetheinyl transferase EntD